MEKKKREWCVSVIEFMFLSYFFSWRILCYRLKHVQSMSFWLCHKTEPTTTEKIHHIFFYNKIVMGAHRFAKNARTFGVTVDQMVFQVRKKNIKLKEYIFWKGKIEYGTFMKTRTTINTFDNRILLRQNRHWIVFEMWWLLPAAFSSLSYSFCQFIDNIVTILFEFSLPAYCGCSFCWLLVHFEFLVFNRTLPVLVHACLMSVGFLKVQLLFTFLRSSTGL